MKIVFFGTPDYVLPVINKINQTWKDNRGKSPIVAVVTQPPKITGRKKILTYSAIDTWAHKHKVPIFFNPIDLLESGLKWDLGILAAYGQIISQDVINAFPNGMLNIHPSILPKFRGASPIQATIISGRACGVTIIKLDNLMDHGQIVAQFEDKLLDSDTTETLTKRLFERATEVLIKLIPAYLNNKIALKEQNHNLATYTRLIKKEDGYIPFEILEKAISGEKFKLEIGFIYKKSKKGAKLPVYSVDNSQKLLKLLKAFTPWPGIWTTVKILSKDTKNQNKATEEILSERRMKILKAHIEKQNKSYKLIPEIVQLEGKNPVSWDQFKQSYLKDRILSKLKADIN